VGVFHETLIVKPEGTVARRGYCCSPAVKKGYFLAVLFMHLDGFKLLNDSLGRVAGEELLIDVAGHVRTRMRRSAQRDADQQSIAAWVGGDNSSGTMIRICPGFIFYGSIENLRSTFSRCTSAE